jgi:Plant transposon protein
MDDDDMWIMGGHFLFMTSGMMMAAMCDSNEKKKKTDHRALSRTKRTKFKHEEAQYCVFRDYLGPHPLFDDKQFKNQFRISKQRFQCLMEDISNNSSPEFPFFTPDLDSKGVKMVSLEAKLLLPLKTLSYGVPPGAFRDYFQMSESMARTCCFELDSAINRIYSNEYLRKPTARDLKSIVGLHKKVHKVNGKFGSIDCCHTWWKNCPKGWAGSFQGKDKRPSIILEAISDYNLWFWQVSYGYCGSLNDLNVLNLSPFMQDIVTGTFCKVEKEAGVVPYSIAGQQFNQLYVLADGIYPEYSRFVKGFKQPILASESNFTKWQEGARKEIERAFGVLQGKFQFTARPIPLFKMNEICQRMGTCIILHNMCVSDRIMGDCRQQYDASNDVAFAAEDTDAPDDLADNQNQIIEQETTDSGGIGVAQAPRMVADLLSNSDRFGDLSNRHEHARLMTALIQTKGTYVSND